MSLKEQQDLLARLYTDPESLRRFETSPESISAEFGLSTDEQADLAAIAHEEIQLFADSLFRKRYHEVQNLLPISSRAIGTPFQELFRGYAASFNPTSVKKHLEDALHFASFLLTGSDIDAHARDAIRFEKTRLIHNSTGRLFSVVLLTHDPRLTMDVGEGPLRRWRPSVAVWIRIGKTSRFTYI